MVAFQRRNVKSPSLPDGVKQMYKQTLFQCLVDMSLTYNRVPQEIDFGILPYEVQCNYQELVEALVEYSKVSTPEMFSETLDVNIQLWNSVLRFAFNSRELGSFEDQYRYVNRVFPNPFVREGTPFENRLGMYACVTSPNFRELMRNSTIALTGQLRFQRKRVKELPQLTIFYKCFAVYCALMESEFAQSARSAEFPDLLRWDQIAHIAFVYVKSIASGTDSENRHVADHLHELFKCLDPQLTFKKFQNRVNAVLGIRGSGRPPGPASQEATSAKQENRFADIDAVFRRVGQLNFDCR